MMGAAEFSAARKAFERLGARPDLAQLDRIVPATGAGSETQRAHRREIEVLCSHRPRQGEPGIANELHLSERTVHRHVSNIFTKLDVDSRTAAVAYGIKHRIVEVGTSKLKGSLGRAGAPLRRVHRLGQDSPKG